VAQIRQAWPEVRIIVRGDAGFCREELRTWCEAQGIDYVLGLPKNERLKARLAPDLEQAEEQYRQTGRVFKEFAYQTRARWSRARRVIAKAEHLEKGSNPRFVVTSLKAEAWPAQALYEKLSCARGEMGNRIKEQLMLFADRTSTAFLRSNQLRLYFSSVAYLLMHALRRLGLRGTELAPAQCATIRLKLLKIGALIRVSVRKVWLSRAAIRTSSCSGRSTRGCAPPPCPSPDELRVVKEDFPQVRCRLARGQCPRSFPNHVQRPHEEPRPPHNRPPRSPPGPPSLPRTRKNDLIKSVVRNPG